MGGSVVLPTWMLHLDDWNEMLINEQTWEVSVNCENNTFYETHGENH